MFDGNLNVVKIAYDAIPEGIVIIDCNAHIVFANKAMERSLGYKVKELVGKDSYILIPDIQKVHRDYFKGFFQDSINISSDNVRSVLGLHKNGKLVPLEVKFSSFEYDGKKYAQALIIDISKRKEKEKEIIEEKTRLKNTVKKTYFKTRESS